MKGTTKFLIKGIYLILVLLIIGLFINRIFSLNVMSSKESADLKFNSRASNIIEILSGSKSCLAYEEIGTIQGNDKELSTHRILDKEKLDEFQSNYEDIEPGCAKDFAFGYRVEVNTFPFEIETSKESPKTKKTLSVKIDPEKWEFGDSVFSVDDAFKKSMTISIPITVYYDNSKFVPGKMKITLVMGKLESVVGFVEMACSEPGEQTSSMVLTYPVDIEKIQGENHVCMYFLENKKCQRLSCQKDIQFTKTESSGTFIFHSIVSNNILKINT